MGVNSVPTLTNYHDNETAIGNKIVDGHLYVKLDEGENGGGTITWTLTKFTMSQFSLGDCMGAFFRAYTKEGGTKTYFKAGDKISNFAFEMRSYERNGKELPNKSGAEYIERYEYTRQLIAGDGKNIQIIPRYYTRRNITRDFGLTDYDYVLGGFNVYSMLAYEDNNFLFTNPNGLEITALNLMGKNIRNLVINTNYNRTIDVLDYLRENNGYSEMWDDEINDALSDDEPDYYNERWVYGYGAGWNKAVHSGTATGGALVELSRLGGQPGEYITACYFTVDTDQLTYKANYQFSGFTYIGQFHDDEANGQKTQQVYLQQLNDDATYAQAKTPDNWNGGKKNGQAYFNYAINDHVFGADQTTIGWTNTGVGAVDTKVEATYDDNGYAIKQTTFSPGSVIKIYSDVESGYHIATQDMLIDPVLVINVPKGISLDLASIRLYRGTTSVKYKVEQLDNANWTTYRITQIPTPYSLVATERLIQGEVSNQNQVGARFQLVVSPQCPSYDLSLQDLVMWDVRNTAGAADTSTGNITGDAIDSHWGNQCVRPDENNFLGYGDDYMVANNGVTISIKPLIGLLMDLGIKPIENLNDAQTNTGFTTYDGQNESIVWVKPGGYADVKLSYISTSASDYFEDTAIYVPIPKYEKNFGNSTRSYFQNINLTDPFTQTDYRPFGFTMELTGPVNLKSDDDSTQWTTYYAVHDISQNETPHQAVTGDQQDTWEPVVYNGGDINWASESDMRMWMLKYSDVRMVKFVAESIAGEDNHVPTGGTGSGIMRLRVHGLNETPGPASFGTYNYWRAYGKAVVNKGTGQGEWAYTSVVAATPSGETVVGQFFVDNDKDGRFYPPGGDFAYTAGKYTATIYDSQGKALTYGTLNVDENGAFALQDRLGRTVYLPQGNYVIRIQDHDDVFEFANTSYQSSINQESPSGLWYNNVQSNDGNTASFTLTVGTGTTVHRIGIGLKAKVVGSSLEGKIFIDRDRDGFFDSDEKGYSRGQCTVTLTRDDGTMAARTLTVDQDGYFALKDSNGDYEILSPGAYTVTVTRNDTAFMYANVAYNGSIGKESPAGEWHNNTTCQYISSKPATWKFTVVQQSDGIRIHRVGVALNSSDGIWLQAYKTLNGGSLNAGDFTFRLTPLNGAPINDPRGYAENKNGSDGVAWLDHTITYYTPGTYRYEITEEIDSTKSDIIFDTHTTIAEVTVTEANDGVISASVVYDNSAAITDDDRNDGTVARFTNYVAYELPETGGAGTTSYTIGGLLLITAAILLYIHNQRRRKEV